MAKLIVICDSLEQADCVFNQTVRKLSRMNPDLLKAYKCEKRVVYGDDSARFVTAQLIEQKHLDRGFRGMFISAGAFIRAINSAVLLQKEENRRSHDLP